MKLITMGDSITVGTYTAIGQDSPSSIANPNYTEWLRRALGCEIAENYGINGTAASSSSPVNTQSALVFRCDKYQGGDFVVIAIGTNDYGTNVPLGRVEDREKGTFFGALSVIFATARKNNPKAKIAVLSPLPRADEGKNQSGYTLDDYRQALQIRAKEWGYVFIDGKKLPINPLLEEDKMRYVYDGVHFNEEGHVLIADLLFNQMKGE